MGGIMFSLKSLSLVWLLSIVVLSTGAADHPQVHRSVRAINISKATLSSGSCSVVSVRRLITQFESNRRSARERARRSLDQLVSRCKNQPEILASLTDMTRRTCEQSMLFANMQAQWGFEGITLSLAKAGYEPTIPILVKCINISARETGLTKSYWPAQNSLIAFGQKVVLPVSKLLHNDEELACAAAEVLSSVGGNEAKDALTKALSESRKPISHACIQAALANIRE